MGDGRSKDALRRYPALAYLIGAGLLALLLPSALTLPNSGPPTLAEYAPVTGQSDAASGDVSAFGQTSSGGVGAAAGRGGAGTVDAEQIFDSGGRFVRKAGTKRCVGQPPRQTEDPLSPPCIAFYEGDNSGATYRGVTRDEVNVVLQLENSNGDNSLTDCSQPPNSDDGPRALACKSYMRFFNERYQTYGRTVRLYDFNGTTWRDDDRLKQFAYGAVSLDVGSAKSKVMSVGHAGGSRSRYSQYAPYLTSFQADDEDKLRTLETYVCDKLANRPARFSGNVADQNKTRKFGLIATNSIARYSDQFKSDLKKMCGVTISIDSYDYKDATAPSRMQADGVTTVLIGVADTGHATITSAAAQSGWFPEWVIMGWSVKAFDTNTYGRLGHPAEWRNSFGVTFDHRRDAVIDQPWHRAYREGCPDCPEIRFGTQSTFIPFAYDVVQMIFYGIQASGPKLTPDNFDKGLHSIDQNRSSDPYRPAAYFAPGNWSFVKDATEIRWDPSGRPPGSGTAGCYRLPGGGVRYRAGEWPTGDSSLDVSGPCQGDAIPE